MGVRRRITLEQFKRLLPPAFHYFSPNWTLLPLYLKLSKRLLEHSQLVFMPNKTELLKSPSGSISCWLRVGSRNIQRQVAMSGGQHRC